MTAPTVLPLEVRRRLWDTVWQVLLAPADRDASPPPAPAPDPGDDQDPEAA